MSENNEVKDLDWLLAEISRDWTDEDWARHQELKKIFRAEAERIRLGIQLKNRIQELGLTQKAIAESLQVQPAEISRIIKGRTNYSANTHLRLLNQLGLRVEYVKIDQTAA
jgi:predicted XRE-type DNA-binding protein